MIYETRAALQTVVLDLEPRYLWDAISLKFCVTY